MLECSSCGPETAAKALGLVDPGDKGQTTILEGFYLVQVQ